MRVETEPEYAVAGRTAVWLYVLLVVVFLVSSHLASEPDLLPHWAQMALLTALCTVTSVGVLMFGRHNSTRDFLASTAALGAWTLALFAAVAFSNPICLYLALIPLITQIVADCLANRGTSSKAFIVLLSLWVSTGILLTVLLHGPFGDLALVGRLSSIAWYLDLRFLLTIVLVIFILCRSLLAALKAPTRRLIREIAMQLRLPEEGGLFKTIARALVDSVNDLILRHLAHFVNVLTGVLSVIMCYLAATGRGIGATIRRQVINMPVFGIVFRPVAVFVALLFVALVLPPLAEATLKYIRGDGMFDHVLAPLADLAISLVMVVAVQLLQPVDSEQFIHGAGRAVFFVVCVLLGAKSVAIGLSHFDPLGFSYARNVDALYLALLVCIVVAALAGLKRRDEEDGPNKSVDHYDSHGGDAA